MSNSEAKFILGAYRPNGTDAGDPDMTGALEQARRDPALGAWLAGMLAFDAAVAGKLRDIQPPAGLRESILTGGKMSGVRRSDWWRQPLAWAIAASVALALVVAASWSTKRAVAEEPMAEFAADYIANGGFSLSEHSPRLDDLKVWLRQHNSPLPAEIPPVFAELRSKGCRTVDYRGKGISLICFGKGKSYHLFVANRDDLPMLPARAVPQYLTHRGLAVAAWADATRYYVVVAHMNIKALQQSLGMDKT